MSDLLDVSVYTRAPRMDVPSALAVGRALLEAMPSKAPAAVKRSGERLGKRLDGLQRGWQEREQRRQLQGVDRRPFDNGVDTAWRAGDLILSGVGSLPHDLYPRAARAASLRATLFPQPDGLSWLKLPYEAQWAESERRLRLLDEAKLEGELVELAGADLLAELRRTHAAYGQALGITKAVAAEAEADSLLEALQAVASEMTRYMLAVAVIYDPDEPSTARVVRDALAPIDRYRTDEARREAQRESGAAAEAPAAAADDAQPT